MTAETKAVLRLAVVLVLALSIIIPGNSGQDPWILDSIARASAMEAPAHSASGSPKSAPVPIELDLTSTNRSLSPGRLVQSSPVVVQEGGAFRTILPGQLVTAAERLALYQILSTGQQSLLLGVYGNATGGSFVAGPNFSKHVTSVVVPSNVTMMRDFGVSGALNLAGNLTNSGVLQAISTNPQTTTAVINANNITNNAGALITSMLPIAVSSIPMVRNLSINMTALNNIVNAGVIESAGSLTMRAGNAITSSY